MASDLTVLVNGGQGHVIRARGASGVCSLGWSWQRLLDGPGEGFRAPVCITQGSFGVYVRRQRLDRGGGLVGQASELGSGDQVDEGLFGRVMTPS